MHQGEPTRHRKAWVRSPSGCHLPYPTMPRRSTPCHSVAASPSQPCRTPPNQCCRSIPVHPGPSLTYPLLPNPTRALLNLAIPIRAPSALPYHAVPNPIPADQCCLAVPFRSIPSLTYPMLPTIPCRASPTVPNHAPPLLPIPSDACPSTPVQSYPRPTQPLLPVQSSAVPNRAQPVLRCPPFHFRPIPTPPLLTRRAQPSRPVPCQPPPSLPRCCLASSSLSGPRAARPTNPDQRCLSGPRHYMPSASGPMSDHDVIDCHHGSRNREGGG